MFETPASDLDRATAGREVRQLSLNVGQSRTRSNVPVLSCNLNGRTSQVVEQVAAVAERRPDIVALQEVTIHSVTALTGHLAAVASDDAMSAQPF
jgi:hypothetical protein